MPFQSEKQRRYLWANEPEIARDWSDTYGSRIKKDDGGITDVPLQAGVENHLGKQETVTVPKHWKSGKDHPETELAYITKPELDLILEADFHGSLKEGPNEGPGGVMSLNDPGTGRAGSEITAKMDVSSKDPGWASTGVEPGGRWDTTMSPETLKEIKKTETKKAKKFKKQAKAKRPTFLQKAQTWGIQNMAKTDQARIIAALNYAATKGGRYVGDTEETWGDLYPSYKDPTLFDDGTRGYKEKTIKDFDTGKRTYGIPEIGPQFYTPGEGKLSLLANLAGGIFSGPITSERLKHLTEQGGKLSSLDPNMTRDEYMKEFRPRAYAKENLNTGGRDRDPEWIRAGYSSYAAWQAAQGGGGGGGATAATTTTPSAFQASLTGMADTPDYYVGENPLASNIAWGKKMGVDPRTMGLTSWAAEGGRIPAAYGGIMDSETGRRAYGIGSFFKKIGRAAKKVLKSPIGKAALIGAAGYFGPLAFGAKAAGFGQWANVIPKTGFMANLLRTKGATAGTWGKLSPWKLGIAGLSALPFFMGGKDDDDDDKFDYEGAKNKYADEIMRIKRGVMAGSLNPNEFSYLPSNYTYTGAEGGRAGMYAGGQSTPSDYTMEDAMMTTTQDKLGGITDVMKQADLNRQGSIGQYYAADGGRIGYSEGSGSYLDYVKAMNALGKKPMTIQIFNSLEGFMSIKEMIAMESPSEDKAQGGRIGYAAGTGRPPITMGQVPQAPQAPPQMPGPHAPPMPAPQPNRMAGMPGGMPGGMNPMMAGMNRPMMNRPMMGGRMMAQEGGLMDLGGMEKDYRQEGGFVPLGGKEKADDVPARLSKNEFVFTADAVRGAGDGDIDKGAEVMENIMKNLEQGGQISEETQGLSGAQEMFGVSERLSEVV